LPAAEKTLFKQESMTTGGKKNLTLVKPDNPLFVPPERTGLFHEDLTDTPPVGAFQSGLPEKFIEVPGPLVQQAIARAIAGLSESQAFQAMDTTQMAKVNRLAHGVPMDVVSETQVDAQGLLEQEAKEASQSKKPYGKKSEKESEKTSVTKAAETQAEGDTDELSKKALADTDDADQVTESLTGKAPLSADTGNDHATDGESAEARAEDGLPDNSAEAKASDAQSQKESSGAEDAAGTKVAKEIPEGGESPAQKDAGYAETMDEASEPADSDGAQALSGDEGIAEAANTNEDSGEHAREANDSDATKDEPPPKDPRQEAIENFPVPEGMQLVSIEDLEAMHQEAYESGRQAGLEEAATELDEAVNAAKEFAHQEGYDKGYEEAYAKGEAAARDELQAEVDLAAQDLKDLTQKLEEAAKDTDQFYAPLLKLAMHLAEQLVRGELTASGKAIAHLVETSLAEFENDPSSPILVKLNPEDLERIKDYETLLPKNAILKSDPTMFVGSVRVQINGAVVEDLVERRSMALWQALTRGQDAGEPPPSFLKNLELMKEAFDEVNAEAETAQEPSLDYRKASLDRAVAPEILQADTSDAGVDHVLKEPVSEESVPENLVDEELPPEESITEESTEEEPRERLVAVEEGSSATESPSIDEFSEQKLESKDGPNTAEQPVSQSFGEQEPSEDEEPKS
jgi:flagellar biosynthesis/type III secretory pathway protein FliH